tara:strand:+ start:222 stop:443 length:222 start_codon:yes stop_codon:yes gene_type:complete
MSDSKSYKLSDNTISKIVQLIQLGILTGTDISDQMRTLQVVHGEDNKLDPCPKFVEMFDENLEKMQEIADSNA